MTVEEQLRDLMIKKSGSVNKFSQEIGVPQSTIFSIFQRGVGKANINSIIAICQALKISVDELADGRITYLSDMNRPIIEFEKLSERNQEKLQAYYQALIDSQGDKS